MSTQQEFLLRLTRLLGEAGIPYMTTGSTSSSIHGCPRATQDVDIVIDSTHDQLDSFITLLGQDYYVSRDAASEALRRRGMFNVIGLDGGWKADLIIRRDRPFSHEEFRRRHRIEVMGQVLWIAASEDIILSKLEWMKGRDSDIQYSDALGIAIAQWGNLDLAYLKKWAVELGVEEPLAHLLDEARTTADEVG
ncbi:MAG: hypothetical protein QM570_04175 [Planctomycetota bacterium]|nr:hypothetical protein [Planctomycetota bacterium]